MSVLTRNILFNLLGNIGKLIIGFIGVKYVFSALGKDVLGVIYFTVMLNALIIYVIDMGIGVTATKEIAAHFRKEKNYIIDMIQTGSFFFWGLFCFLTVLVYYLAPIFVDRWIQLESLPRADAIFSLRMLGIFSLLAFPSTFYISLLKGLQLMHFTNSIQLIVASLRQIGIVVIIYLKGDLYPVVFWYSISYFLEIAFFLSILLRQFAIRAFLPNFHLYVVKRNANFLSNMTLVTLAWSVNRQADKAIISKLLPIGLLGYYSVAQRFVEQASILARSVRSAAFPVFSDAKENSTIDDLRLQYFKLQDFVCLANVPILMFVIFSSFPIFRFVFDKEVANTLLLPTVFLTLASYLNGAVRIPLSFSVATNHPQISRNASILSLFMVLPFTVLFIYEWGLLGASLAIVLRPALYLIYAIPRIMKRCLQVPVIQFYTHFLKYFGAMLIFYGIPFSILLIKQSLTLLNLGSFYFLASCLFFVYSYFIVSKDVKKSVWNLWGLSLKRMGVADEV